MPSTDTDEAIKQSDAVGSSVAETSVPKRKPHVS